MALNVAQRPAVHGERRNHSRPPSWASYLASLPLLGLIASTHNNPIDDDGPWDQPAELDRLEVYQATGMLISELGVDATEALVRLRAHAIATNRTASQVAMAIIERRLVLERDDHDDTRRSR